MENTIQKGDLTTLNPGDTLLVQARKVANSKIQLEFAEIIQTVDRPVNLLSILNRSDAAFATRARRAWVTAEPADASEDFNINFGDDGEWYVSEKGEVLDLNILNPEYNGFRMRLRVMETLTPTTWQEAHLETSAKRRGSEGDFITHGGEYIFSNTDMVLTNDNVKHIFLEADDAPTSDTSTSVIEKVAEPEKVEESDLGI